MDFFDELYQRFSKRYPESLRRLQEDERSSAATTVMRHIERNNLRTAISKLRAYEEQLDPEDLDQLSNAESRFNKYEKEKEEGTVLQQDLNVEYNKICKILRELAKKLD